MADISVRGLDDDVRERLRVRASQHGRSMEAEIRTILTDAVTSSSRDTGLAQALLARFADAGGIDLDIPPHTDPARAADFA